MCLCCVGGKYQHVLDIDMCRTLDTPLVWSVGATYVFGMEILCINDENKFFGDEVINTTIFHWFSEVINTTIFHWWWSY
jgi:hypothetical protein